MLRGWPPIDALVWTREGQQDAATLPLECSAGACLEVARCVQVAAAHIDSESAEHANLEVAVSKLHSWAHGLQKASGIVDIDRPGRFMQSSAEMLTTIRLASLLQGGSAALLRSIRLALALVVPEQLLQSIEASLACMGQQTCIAIVSSSHGVVFGCGDDDAETCRGVARWSSPQIHVV